MIVLVGILIYVYTKFAKHARQKDLPPVKWGLIGSGAFLVVSISFMTLVVVLNEYDVIHMNIRSMSSNITLSALGYVMGTIAAYIAFQQLEKQSNGLELSEIDEFGRQDANDNFEN